MIWEEVRAIDALFESVDSDEEEHFDRKQDCYICDFPICEKLLEMMEEEEDLVPITSIMEEKDRDHDHF